MQGQLNPLFSLFVAQRDAGDRLIRCVRSIYDQTFTEYEVLLVDDASETIAGQSAWLEALARTDADPRFVPVETTSRVGKLANFCALVEQMRGRVIVELDGDDWFARPDALAIIARAYAASPSVGATTGSHEYADHDPPVIFAPVTQPQRGHRFMQNGFALSTPAPRTWLREYTLCQIAAFPETLVDGDHLWRYNADLTMFGPAICLAPDIACIEEVLVSVTRSPGRHEWQTDKEALEAEGLRQLEMWLQKEWDLNAAKA